MTDREYLEEVRLRINQSGDLSVLGYCDFLEPKRYFVGAPEPRVEGVIYFVGDRTNQLKFALLLPADTESLEDIAWISLLPPQGSRGWAQVDNDQVIIDASAAEYAVPPQVAAT
jgi:hypothetical protein